MILSLLYKPGPVCCFPVLESQCVEELRKHCFEICVVEIFTHDEKSLCMGCLLITDGAVQFTQCLVSIVVVTAWRDVDCNKQDGRKLPW